MEKVLVTGGGGFLGTATCRLLHQAGFKVISYSRKAYPHLEAMGIETVQADITDQEALKEVISSHNIKTVFHIAAKAGVWGSYDSYYQPNVAGTMAVVKVCQDLGVRNLIYTSTPSVTFAGKDQDGVDESAPYPETFINHYQSTKAQAEKIVLAANSPKLRTIALRPHLIWGPGDTQLVPRIVNLAQKKKLKLVGPRGKLVDAVYIDNAAAAQLAALGAMDKPEATGKPYFITNHEPWPLEDIINGILKAHDMDSIKARVPEKVAYTAGAVLEGLHRVFLPRREPAMTRFVARQLSTAHWFDPENSKRQLGYIPKVSMDEGMEKLRQGLCKNA